MINTATGTDSIATLTNADAENAGGERWPWCYLHGYIQRVNAAMIEVMYYDSPECDLFIANAAKPPQAGEYKVDMYGFDCIAVLATRHGTLDGRIVLASDSKALAYARNPAEWM